MAATSMLNFTGSSSTQNVRCTYYIDVLHLHTKFGSCISNRSWDTGLPWRHGSGNSDLPAFICWITYEDCLASHIRSSNFANTWFTALKLWRRHVKDNYIRPNSALCGSFKIPFNAQNFQAAVNWFLSASLIIINKCPNNFAKGRIAD